MICTCPQCGAAFEASASRVNRAKKQFSPVYCGRECSGLARRKCKTPEQKRAEKKIYDANRRASMANQIKAAKAEYHRRTYDPNAAAAKRKERMPKHVEYCRRPEYRAWKAEYDKQYLARKEFGEFWEAAILAREIRKTCLSMQDDTEIRRNAGTLNKHQNRRREYERTHSNKPEIGSLGDASKP